MTKAEFFENLSYPIVRLYMDCEDRLLGNICRRIAKSVDLNNPTLKWNVRKLNDMAGLTEDAMKEISKTSKKASKLVEKVLLECAKKGLSEDGVSDEVTQGVVASINGLASQAKSQFNVVNTNMLAGTQDSFGNILRTMNNERSKIMGLNETELVTGVKSFQQAVSSAIKEMADNGINAFVDNAGRHWTPEAYVSMDLRTTTANATREAVKAQGQDYGLDVILVSSHAGARPLCEPYQGRCYSMSGRYGTIKDAHGQEYDFEPIQNTSYGEPAGLFGINCRHTFRYIEEGAFVSRETPVETEKQKAENAKRYAQSQEQRAMEREIRKYSRESALLKDAGFTEFAKTPSGRASEVRREYRAFCEETGRTPRWDRTQIH